MPQTSAPSKDPVASPPRRGAGVVVPWVASLAVHAAALAVVGAAVLAVRSPPDFTGPTIVTLDPTVPAPREPLPLEPLTIPRAAVDLPEPSIHDPVVPRPPDELPDLPRRSGSRPAPEHDLAQVPPDLGRLPSREPAVASASETSGGTGLPADVGQAGKPVPPSPGTSSPPSAPGEPDARASIDPATCPLPAYPALARRRGWSGRVLVRVHVAADGAVVSAEMAGSSGYDVLDRAATDAVRRWRFRPAARDGVAVADVVDVPVRFELQDG